jgi:hypothetical protein
MGTSTNVHTVQNERNHTISFIDTERGSANQDIAPQGLVRVDCPVPWAQNQTDFIGHRFLILNKDTGAALFQVWQRSASDGNIVRSSTGTTGFVDPGTPVNGASQAGGKDRNLRIDMNGLTLNELA